MASAFAVKKAEKDGALTKADATAEGDDKHDFSACTVHVSGLKVDLQEEKPMRNACVQYGKVLQATVRQRPADDARGWALVTFCRPSVAAAVLKKRDLGGTLAAKRFDPTTALGSTGAFSRI